jgi:hypothetical protein
VDLREGKPTDSKAAGRRSLAGLLSRDAAHRIAAGIAKLPELLKRA